MRKTLVVFGLLALYLGFSCVPAQAQTAISLILTTGAVTFTTISPGSTAMASFAATGPALQISPSATYTFSLTGGPATLTQTTPGNFTVSSTPLTLTLTGTGGTTGALTGTVNLFDSAQSMNMVLFNNTNSPNLTVTSASGSLANFSGSKDSLALWIVLGGATPIDNLGGSTKSLVSSALLMPTPEPTSMLLFGAGLLALGAILRRRVSVA
jgi:hypothetical protein